MGTRRRPQGMCHRDGAGYTGAETDAVIRAGDIVVHGLWNTDDFDTFFMHADTVAQRVISSDGDEIINAQVIQVFQNLGCEVVDILLVAALQMGGDIDFRHMAGTRPGRVEEGAAGPADPVDHFLGEYLIMVALIVGFFPHHPHQPSPAAPDADDLIPFPQRTDGDRPDGGIKPGDISPSRQNPDNAFFGFDLCHFFSWNGQAEIRRTNDLNYSFPERKSTQVFDFEPTL